MPAGITVDTRPMDRGLHRKVVRVGIAWCLQIKKAVCPIIEPFIGGIQEVKSFFHVETPVVHTHVPVHRVRTEREGSVAEACNAKCVNTARRATNDATSARPETIHFCKIMHFLMKVFFTAYTSLATKLNLVQDKIRLNFQES